MIDPRLALAFVAMLSARFPSVERALRDPVRREALMVRAKLVAYACDDAGIRRCATLFGIGEVESGFRLRDERGRMPLMGCRPYVVDDPRQARCAAMAWTFARRRCHTEARALVRYQYGECAVPRGRRYRRARRAAVRYVRNVQRIARAIERRMP